MERLREQAVEHDDLTPPDNDMLYNSLTSLFQLGYLNIRLVPDDKNFWSPFPKSMHALDYSNLEIRASMARRLLESYLASGSDARSLGFFKRFVPKGSGQIGDPNQRVSGQASLR